MPPDSRTDQARLYRTAQPKEKKQITSYFSDTTLAQWLEASAYLAAIIGAIAGGVVFTLRARRESVDALRKDLARAWTNEGDIHSVMLPFVTLDLALSDGDLFGSLSTSAHDRALEAHVDVAWGRARLHVTELLGRNLVQIGEVSLRLSGNRNRLLWQLRGKEGTQGRRIKVRLPSVSYRGGL